MWKCRYCGNENEGMFCARCGNKRPERQPAPQKGKIGTAATVAIVASATAVAIAVVVLCVTVSKATIKQRARGFVTDYESAEEINTEVLKEEPEVIEKEAENVERRPVEELEPEEVISEEKPVEEVKEEKKNDGYSAMVAKREEFYGRAEGIQKYSDSIDWDYLNQSQLNINSGEIFSKWDALLNDVYQYLKKTKSKSEFEKLPLNIQKAIGSHSFLKELGMANTSQTSFYRNEFQKKFKEVLEKEKKDLACGLISCEQVEQNNSLPHTTVHAIENKEEM